MRKLLILILPIIALACSQTVKTPPVCREATIDCEMQKKFTALKIIQLPADRICVDAYGDSLITGRWYLRSNSTHILFPIGVKNPDNTIEVGGDQMDLLCYPLQSSKKIKTEKIRINTGDAGSPGGLYISAEVLVSEDGFLNLSETDKLAHPEIIKY